MSKDFKEWMTIFTGTLIAMKLLGPEFGIAIIIAEVSSIRWKMRIRIDAEPVTGIITESFEKN